MDGIKKLVDSGAQSAIVVGGGFIGLEMVETLHRRGLDVTLIEKLAQVMPPLDPEIAQSLHNELKQHEVRLHLCNGVTRFDDRNGQVVATLESGATVTADLVILAVGVRPDTPLARDADLKLSERGAIVVDEHMRTSDPHIYAVGDAVEVRDPVLGGTTFVPLAGPANRQARIAIDNIFGRESTFRGTQGTSVVRLFGLTAGSTGPSEKILKQRGAPYRKVYVHRGHHVGYFPGAQSLHIKLLYAPENGRVLGAQIVGADGVDKRIDVLAVAIQAGLTVHDLEEAELAYAPQYGAAKDPVNIAGFVASNDLSGDEEFAYTENLLGANRDGCVIVDVRDPMEFAMGHVPDAMLLPLTQIRERWRELPQDKQIVTYCGVGQRSYYANRILRQKGLKPKNLAGGFNTYQLVAAALGENGG